MTDRASDDAHARGAELLLKAFQAAREAGHSDWRAMTTAVLKNRLLDLTGREFQESDWDASSFTEFLSQFPDVVAVDPTTRPATARLVDEATAGVPAPSDDEVPALGPQRQIRSDLWNAVLDYSSGRQYLWDGDAAVPLVSTESVEGPDEKLLPTLTEEDFKRWREEFTESEVREYPSWEQPLEHWRDSGYGAAALPGRFRGRWIGELKRRVVDRLVAWFRDKDIELPGDLVQDTASGREVSPETERLRDLVVECVRVMSRTELDELRLPPSVILRARSGRSAS